MKKILGIGLVAVGATVVASIYTMIKEEKEQKERAAKILEENKINEAFRRMTQDIKNAHDDIVRRMERDSNI